MAPKKSQQKKAAPAVEETKKEEPPAKKAKEEDAKAKEQEAKSKTPEDIETEKAKAEEDKEKEKDAPKDSRKTIAGKQISFEPADCTLNVMPTMGGTVLTALSDGGMQFLIGGARASVGLKAGRYLYEVKVLEALTFDEGKGYNQNRSRGPQPKQMVRVGFSVEGSSLILGESTGGVAFDSNGIFFADGKSTSKPTGKFGRDLVIGVLLNLDPKSPNVNTVSLFRNGIRATDPMPLPEGMQGKVLFPHISFRNMTVQVSFGPAQMKALPFKCRMVQDAAEADVQAKPPKKGKCTVVFPVGLPDEGTFDTVDTFLEENSSFFELSDRKTQEWALKSGVWKSNKKGWTSSNDKPAFDFGLPTLDDMSACRVINAIAPCVPRDYVVMEVKQNLCPEDRAANLRRFNSAHYKKVARVTMGKPPAEYIAKIHKAMLEQKQAKLETEWKNKKAEKERKKLIAKRQKEMEKLKKKAEKERKKKAEEAKNKAEEAKKKAEEAKKKAEEEKKAEDEKGEAKEEKTEEAKAEDKKDVEMKPEGVETKKEETEAKEEEEEDEKEEEEPNEPDDPMPVAELTEEEKAKWFKTSLSQDLANTVLSMNFAKFTIPDKSEGFDEIIFDWQTEKEAKKYLKDFVLKLKQTSRIDDLMPGEWFKTTSEEWEKQNAAWEKACKPKEEAGEMKEGEATDTENKPKEDVTVPEEAKDFTFEDWAQHQLRCELYLLAAAFKKDVDDPERPGIHESHIPFYFSKYFRKGLIPKQYGKDTIPDTLTFAKDTVSIEDGILTLKFDGDKTLGFFVEKQKEARKERQRRIDAGDETARVDFSVLQKQKELAEKQKAAGPQGGAGGQRPQWQQGGKGKGGKGKGKKW